MGILELPNELTLLIISYLDIYTVTSLLQVNKSLRRICIDNTIWRARAFEDSPFVASIARKVPAWSSNHPDNSPGEDPKRSLRAHLLANWDYTSPDEPISWYREYAERYGRIQVNWFEQPQIRDSGISDLVESRGLSLYTPGKSGRDSCTDDLFAVAPLDDGTVCIWDVSGTRGKQGSVLSISQTPILHMHPANQTSSRSQRIDSSVIESVSIDNSSNRAFFAVQSRLVEVDLSRLEPIGYQSFEWSITTLSQCSTGLPLTVGTSLGIFLHDFRDGSRRHVTPADHSDRVENVLKALFASDPLPPYASLSQPTPLSILHLPSYDSNIATSHDIYVAGRFPSILHYDRRSFPSIVDSIHSGASLCSLASMPHVFDESTHNSRRRQGLLNCENLDSTRALGRTIIAAGEYNTKGSLELYSLGQSRQYPDRAARPSSSSAMVNRQTSAHSKIMSVTTHGSRIVTSDASGNIRWFERDGFTQVRSHRIGSSERIDRNSIFYGMPGVGEMARKMISTQSVSRWWQGVGSEFEQSTEADDNGIVFLTDDKLGMLRFSKEPPFLADDFELGAAMTADEQDEWAYRERMRVVFETENNALGFSLGTGSTI